jgi:stage V sporulation protein G
MKNHLRAQYCNQCGAGLSQDRMPLDADGRAKLYADIAHPINSHCREMIQDHVINEFFDELDRSKQPGYVSRYDDVDMDFQDDSNDAIPARARETRVDRAHQRPAPHDSQAKAAPRSGPPVDKGDAFGSGIF